MFLIFCNKLEKKQCVDLVLKTIISMKFIYPLYTVIFHYFENGIISINYINEMNYYYNEQVMAYLYGQICHFVLDSTVHPYIIYHTAL